MLYISTETSIDKFINEIKVFFFKNNLDIIFFSNYINKYVDPSSSAKLTEEIRGR